MKNSLDVTRLLGFRVFVAAAVVLATGAVPTRGASEPIQHNLQLWMKADAGVTTNASGGVTAWADQSGKANHAAQATSTMTPQWMDAVLNGKPVLRFDGNDDYLDVADAPSIQIVGDLSSFVVAKFEDYANYREVWGKTAVNYPGPNDWYLVQNTGVSRLYRGDGTSASLGSADSSGAITAGEYVVLGFTVTGSDVKQYLNRVPYGSGTITAALADSGTSLKIGTRDDFFCKMKGDIAELLIYDAGLSQADTYAVFDYLLNKYGIIPAEGKFMAVTPADNAAYAAPNLIKIVHLDGALAWDSGNVSLTVDGAAVTPTFVKDGPVATLTYVPSPVFAGESTHTFTLSYPGTAGPQTMNVRFTVGAYTKDGVKSYPGVFVGGSIYGADASGRTGKAGDRAVEFAAATGPVQVHDASFLNALAQNDELCFAFWQKKPGLESASAFWAVSPSGAPDSRGFQAHVPWNDSNIYFDTAGCCDAGTQRISTGIATYPGYTDASWWNNWHHFVFLKRKSAKEIYIDGQFFFSGENTNPLGTDFTELYIGSSIDGANLMIGVIDDFAIFGTALDQNSISALAGGALPTALPASDKLTAYWGFNDFPAAGFITSILPAPNSTSARPDLVQLTHVDGAVAWAQTNVSLKLDDVLVTSTFTKTGSKATITYLPSPWFAVGSTHRVTLTYPNETGAPVAFEWQFTIGSFPVLDPNLATALGTGDSAQPGLKARVWQVDQTGTVNLGNRTHRAEQELAGIIGPNVANLTGATAGVFAVDVVNWNQNFDTAEVGNFQSTSAPSKPDTAIPGIPGSGTSPTDSLAAEVITYLEFPTAGYYTMGVLSDDGFKVTATDTPPRNNLALVITGAGSATGSYYALSGPAGTSKPFTEPVTGQLVYLDPADGCTELVNAGALAGNLALVDRGTCEFSAKIKAAKDAGAIACVVVNNREVDSGEGMFPIEMSVGAAGYQDIPAVMITMVDGDKIKTGVASGVTASLTPDDTPALGEVDGGALGADRIFSFIVPSPGVYPFRCVWYEGGGDAHLEWFSVTSSGEKILINDRSNPTALKGFRGRTATPAPKVTLSVVVQGGNMTIASDPQPLPAGFELQTAPAVTGPWTTQTGANTPMTLPIGAEQATFLRARKP